MIEKVISGGQTGVDRAALDAALEAGIPVGGYCPQGRRAEDGIIPDCYPLCELESPEYEPRTERNVVASDGTLVLNFGRLTGGTRMTVAYARNHGRPLLVVQLEQAPPVSQLREWLAAHGIRVLNVAGPRASKSPHCYQLALELLRRLFAATG